MNHTVDTMPNTIRDIQTQIRDEEHNIIVDKNVSIPIIDSPHPIRCNVYRSLSADDSQKFPILITYGPYGKDIPYSEFAPASFAELNPLQQSPYSCWETPDPVYWTSQGYIVIRCDERGFGQSPGYLDSMSASTAECFCKVIEWSAVQPWSIGKVGLLGVSYFAGTQWRAAARQPKGLTCIVPWEGMSDYYRDRCRHGGILSDKFIDFWWKRQVVTNQYGRPGRAAKKWGDDTIEGDLDDEERVSNCADQTVDNQNNRYRDDPYYASRAFNIEDVNVPLLSVANWGGIGLHLRGNVHGFMYAASKFKYLRCIVGRHDLPFYYQEEVEVQRSFLDAWLKNDDRVGWTKPGGVPAVDMVLRTGDVGYNKPETEKSLPRRQELEWPIARTEYVRYHLTADQKLLHPDEYKSIVGSSEPETKLTYPALGTLTNQQKTQFQSTSFNHTTEITGHIIAHLNVSIDTNGSDQSTTPSDMDLFVTLRHLDPAGKEILYTGTVGDPVPVVKGWLRCSLRKTRSENPKHSAHLPYREYSKNDEELLIPGQVYEVDVEIWPTTVTMVKGDVLVLEVGSGDTDGTGLFEHASAVDRSREKFEGLNCLWFGGGRENWLQLPVIPPKA